MTMGGNMRRQTGLRGSLARTRRQRQASPLAVALAGLASMAASGSAEALVINTSYDGSINSAPAGFSSAFQTAVNFFQSTFTDPITVNIKVGWGEIGGSAIASGALGESQTYLAGYYSYNTVRNAMIRDAKTSADRSAVASLPSIDPTRGRYELMSTAEAKALAQLRRFKHFLGSKYLRSLESTPEGRHYSGIGDAGAPAVIFGDGWAGSSSLSFFSNRLSSGSGSV